MLDLVSQFRAAWWSLRQWGLEIAPWGELAHAEEFRGASLAIVGNAGYLAELEQGRRIDAYDRVLRMNNCRTAGFERQVGARTTLYLSTFHHDVDLTNPAIAEARHLVASVPTNLHRRLDLGVHSRHGEAIIAGLLALGRPRVFAPPLDDFARYIAAIGRYPTTGAAAILLALEHLLPVCGEVYVTGFSFFEGPSHYFSSTTITPRNHDIPREQAWLAELLAPHVASRQVVLDPELAERLEFVKSAVRRAS